jgi:hypothetical protein
MLHLLKQKNYTVHYQIMNYQSKIIGLIVSQENSDVQIMLPCFPSEMLNDIEIKYMDDDEIWKDYVTTRDTLQEISLEFKQKILCEPKIKVIEDNLIVGIITETNQFVQISPPEENFDNDDLQILRNTNLIGADKIITTTNKIDTTRNDIIKKISLESQFYTIFRSTIRYLLNKYENRTVKQKILGIIENNYLLHEQKLKKIKGLLKELTREDIVFQNIDMAVLLSFDKITNCSETCGEKYCLVKDEKCNLIIPDKNLISNKKNENVYFVRIADELVRYKRIRLFMFQPKFFLNIENTEYSIYSNELFIMQSLLNDQYFNDIDVFNDNSHVKNINYDIAQPVLSQNYSNTFSLNEQKNLLSLKDVVDYNEENKNMCIKETVKVIGNIQNSLWKRIFPNTTKEIIFHNTVNCGFSVAIFISQEKFNIPVNVQNIKSLLWGGYKKIYQKYNAKIISILRKQGKKSMMDKIENDVISFEALINSEEYYMTDLDLWVFSQETKIPIILFSSTKIKNLVNDVNWLLLGGNVHDNIYFIRASANVNLNEPSQYNLISPSYKFTDLKEEFAAMVKTSLTGDHKNIQSLEEFLDELIIIKRKK